MEYTYTITKGIGGHKKRVATVKIKHPNRYDLMAALVKQFAEENPDKCTWDFHKEYVVFENDSAMQLHTYHRETYEFFNIDIDPKCVAKYESLLTLGEQSLTTETPTGDVVTNLLEATSKFQLELLKYRKMALKDKPTNYPPITVRLPKALAEVLNNIEALKYAAKIDTIEVQEARYELQKWRGTDILKE